MNKAKILAELLAELSKPSFEGVGSEELTMELYRRCRKGETIQITHKAVRITHSEYFEGLQSADAIKTAFARFAL